MLKEPRFGELADYAQTLDDMAAVFSQEQSLVLFYEDMHADRMAALRTVCRFVGARFEPGHFTELGRRFNRSQQAALPAPIRAHLRELCREQAEGVRARVGSIPAVWEREFGLGSNKAA